MSNLAQVSQIVQGIQRHLGMDDVLAKFPDLDKLSINAYDSRYMTQYPALDLYPVMQDFVIADRLPAHPAEGSEALLEFSLTVSAAQYDTGVEEAFWYAELIRKALNLPVAKNRAGVNWLRVERVRQLQPEKDGNSAFVYLTGNVRVNFNVEPY